MVHDIGKSYSTALRKSGITNFRFHDLRHAFASQLVMAGDILGKRMDTLPKFRNYRKL